MCSFFRTIWVLFKAVAPIVPAYFLFNHLLKLVKHLSSLRVNKLTSVFHASVLLLMMNFVITLSKREAIAEWIRWLLWQCYDRTDAWKTDVNLFFTIKNCQIVLSRSFMHRINYKFICLSAYWQWKLANERARVSAVIVKRKRISHFASTGSMYLHCRSQNSFPRKKKSCFFRGNLGNLKSK